MKYIGDDNNDHQNSNNLGGGRRKTHANHAKRKMRWRSCLKRQHVGVASNYILSALDAFTRRWSCMGVWGMRNGEQGVLNGIGNMREYRDMGMTVV